MRIATKQITEHMDIYNPKFGFLAALRFVQVLKRLESLLKTEKYVLLTGDGCSCGRALRI